MLEVTEEFASKEDAEAWMLAEVDDPYTDNVRFAFLDDAEALRAYGDASAEGCCGFFDAEVLVAGRPAKIGCNFGH